MKEFLKTKDMNDQDTIIKTGVGTKMPDEYYIMYNGVQHGPLLGKDINFNRLRELLHFVYVWKVKYK